MNGPASRLRCETVPRVPLYAAHSALTLVFTFALALFAGCGGGSASPPEITAQPASQTVTAGQTATFSVSATGPIPLTFQWQKNAVNIAGATSARYTTPAV